MRIGRVQQVPDLGQHVFTVGVDTQVVLLAIVTGDMRIQDAVGRDARQVVVRIEAVIDAVHEDVVDVEVEAAVGLVDLKSFLDQHDIKAYTEHLSYCGDSGQLYDLMPIPFTAEAVTYVAERIRHVQDVLERRIGMENVSTYAIPDGEMSELEFLNAVIDEADCGLHLDINNIFVNSINHGFDAHDYLARIPADRILYAHIAGHYREEDDLRVDTHGEDVLPEVWDLLDAAYAQYGVFPTLLERDFNIPPLSELLSEVDRIAQYQARWQESSGANVA